jgi:hypothetical protein
MSPIRLRVHLLPLRIDPVTDRLRQATGALSTPPGWEGYTRPERPVAKSQWGASTAIDIAP